MQSVNSEEPSETAVGTKKRNSSTPCMHATDTAPTNLMQARAVFAGVLDLFGLKTKVTKCKISNQESCYKALSCRRMFKLGHVCLPGR